MFGYQAITDSEYATWKRKSMRRRVLYAFPEGAAPLAALLSMVDPEGTDGPEFTWLEERYREITTKTIANGGFGGWLAAAGAAAATHVSAGNTTLRLAVTAGTAKDFPPSSMIMIADVKLDGVATLQHVNALVTATDTTTDILTVTVFQALTIDNAVGQAGKQVVYTGSANAEGSLSGKSNAITHPINPGNYTQIFRNPFTFSRTALQQGLEYDKTGAYKDMAKKTSLKHLIGMENSLIWGEKSKTAVTDTDGTPTIRRTMAGLLWFLREYEAAGGGSTGYRPNGSALTAWTDDDKRIIDIPTTGAITKAQLDFLLERMFRKTTASSSEKLLLCGSGMLAAINTYYEGKVTTNKDFMAQHKVAFDLRTIETVHGTLHMKSHPRFNEQAWLRYDGMVLDLPNLKYRHLEGSDTKIRKNIHANDFDGRKDEFLTEASLEVWFPETHMYIRNFKSVTA